MTVKSFTECISKCRIGRLHVSDEDTAYGETARLVLLPANNKLKCTCSQMIKKLL
ncbi:MAG: hypothetical protein M3Z26_14005 [Bacteroidota bacterium]|nr:hypothetical protein [Bacteroidota bacterium]